MTSSMGAIILALFFLSGACSLVYEVIWVRMLLVVFGVSAHAVSTVLASFMAGLALGGLYFGRATDRRAERLRTYGRLEIAIGVCALVVPFIIGALDEAYVLSFRLSGESPFFAAVTRLALAFAVLIVPTTLMGATLPVMSKFAVDRIAGTGSTVGGLYAVNTFGAAVGVFVAAFILLPSVGVTGATYLGAATNLLIGATSLLLSRTWAEVQTREHDIAAEEHPVVPRPTVRHDSSEALPTWMRPLTLVAFGLSGFTALGYEVVWTRLLTILHKAATTLSFSTILIAFLLGLASGGAASARLADRGRDPALAFGAIEMLIGLFGLASIALLGGGVAYFSFLESAFSLSPEADLLIVAVVVMFVPTFLMGAVFPIAVRLQVTGLQSVGRRIGDLYAANTGGAIAGSLAAGFVLIPLLGTQLTIQALAWTNVVLGVVLLLAGPLTRLGRKWALVAVLALPAVALEVAVPGDLFARLLDQVDPQGELIYYSEDVGGTVSVYQIADGHRSLRVNGTGEVRTDHAAMQTFRTLGNLPLLLHPEPEKALVVAFGGGVTLSAAELHGLERLDCVEVVPAVFGAAGYFAEYNNGIAGRFDSSHINLIAEDGRTHLLRTDERYDVIICDATHPTTADSWLLYTREFYDLCRRGLKDGGLLAQWVPLHGLTAEDYRVILRTFRSTFPHVSVWLNEIYTILLGSFDPLHIDYARLQRRLARPEIEANLAPVDLGDAVSFLSTLALDRAAVDRCVGKGPINTDAMTLIGYADSDAYGLNGVAALESMRRHLIEEVDASMLSGACPEQVERLEKRLAARRYAVEGTIAMLKGDRSRARERFWRAAAIDPEENVSRRLLEVLGERH